MLKKSLILMLIAVSAASIVLLCRTASGKKTASEAPTILSDSQLEPYLNIRGWDVEKLSDETVRIPEKFNDTYQRFADVLKENGFDIEKYKGKEVRRVLFLVKNYGGDSEVHAELLLDEGKLIGSALIENKPDGFIKPAE